MYQYQITQKSKGKLAEEKLAGMFKKMKTALAELKAECIPNLKTREFFVVTNEIDIPTETKADIILRSKFGKEIEKNKIAIFIMDMQEFNNLN